MNKKGRREKEKEKGEGGKERERERREKERKKKGEKTRGSRPSFSLPEQSYIHFSSTLPPTEQKNFPVSRAVARSTGRGLLRRPAVSKSPFAALA